MTATAAAPSTPAPSGAAELVEKTVSFKAKVPPAKPAPTSSAPSSALTSMWVLAAIAVVIAGVVVYRQAQKRKATKPT